MRWPLADKEEPMGWDKNLWHKARAVIKGQTLTEYALIMLFVGVAAFSAYLGLGRSVNRVANVLTTSLNAAVNAL
jgi:hypothetical protein